MPEWPEGISNGLSSPCAFCGTVPLIDYQVDDATWERLVAPHTRQDVVCLDCLVSMDLDVVSAVRSLQVATPRVTAVFQRVLLYPWHEYEEATDA